MSLPDVIVVGAGIVGAACARELALAGQRVLVLERGDPGEGATAAGMGHIILLDDSEAEFQLTRWSQQLWADLADELPAAAQVHRCGCIWVAADERQWQFVQGKAHAYAERDVPAEVLDAKALAAAEPNLREGLYGGLRVASDQVVYPPVVTHWLLECAVDAGAEVRRGIAVASVRSGGVMLADGTCLEAAAVVDAAGHEALALLPEPIAGVQIRPRKGHVAITERVPGLCHHQLVGLEYLDSAHSDEPCSVAFNAQPRVTGQVLLGSSRQYGARGDEVELPVLARMLRTAMQFLPALADVWVLRAWTGFRAATPDKLPLIGPVPGQRGLLLASGHEGIGITTSLGTGRLVADWILGRDSPIDRAPYRLDRPGRAA